MLQHLPNVSVSHAAGTHSRRHPREIESYEKKNVNRELIDKRERERGKSREQEGKILPTRRILFHRVQGDFEGKKIRKKQFKDDEVKEE